MEQGGLSRFKLLTAGIVSLVCCGLVNCSGLKDKTSDAEVVATKVAPLSASAACAGGIINDSQRVCCPDFCGECGGGGCEERRGGADMCCRDPILLSGKECVDNEPPCRMDADPGCVLGIADPSGTACCPDSCGECGGPGCSGRPGEADACCVGRITASDISCTSSKAPCVLHNDPNCEDGILDATGQACCPASCGACGGEDCSQLPGGPDDCCMGRIVANGDSCLTTEAPCVIDGSAPPFNHPGLFNSAADLQVMHVRVGDGIQPTLDGFLSLAGSPLSSLSYEPAALAIVKVRGGSSTPPEELRWKADAAAAYAHALSWVATGTNAHRDKALAIMNAWGHTFRELECIDENDETCPASAEQTQLEAGWVAPIWAAAGEILRHYDGGSAGWAPTDVQEFARMLKLLAHYAKGALYDRSSNWGASAVLAQIAVGVFTDDRAMYTEGVKAWKNNLKRNIKEPLGPCDSEPCVPNGYPYVSYEFYERGDCNHAQYALLAFAQSAEIAWHQGDDLYGYRVSGESRSRLAMGLEYASGLFLGEYQHYTVKSPPGRRDCTNLMQSGYEMAYNHYKYRDPLPSQEIAQFEGAAIEVRPDGTGHHYNFSGWTTLTHGDISSP